MKIENTRKISVLGVAPTLDQLEEVVENLKMSGVPGEAPVYIYDDQISTNQEPQPLTQFNALWETER